jgi:hypothetical protein
MTAIGGLELVTEVDADNPVIGDLRISRGRFAKITTFGDAVAQAVRVELQWWLGEWFLDTSRGMPYVEKLLRRGITERTIRALLKRRIEAVDGVLRVESMNIAFDRRTRFGDVTDLVIVTTEGEPLPIDNVPIGRPVGGGG